jgi:hypothetical protein
VVVECAPAAAAAAAACLPAEYGSKPWVNPVLSKALEIKASSPPSRYTDPKVGGCEQQLLWGMCLYINT